MNLADAVDIVGSMAFATLLLDDVRSHPEPTPATRRVARVWAGRRDSFTWQHVAEALVILADKERQFEAGDGQTLDRLAAHAAVLARAAPDKQREYRDRFIEAKM